jgi:hypothetical protein
MGYGSHDDEQAGCLDWMDSGWVDRWVCFGTRYAVLTMMIWVMALTQTML